MKGLSIKKIAAIGIGAALVGSALAPVVSAEAFNNLETLEKTDVVSSAGVPVVDVVVGGSAAISDVVWAGNIAARVAQLATKPATGTGSGTITGATVDYSTGGTMTTVGAGETSEADFPTVSKLSVTNTKMPTLVNDTSFKYKFNSSTEQSTTLTETIQGDMTIGPQMATGSNRYAIGEMIGTVAAGDFNYTVGLGTDLNLLLLSGITGLDSNSQNNIRLPIFGKEYVLDEVKSSGELVFYANTNPVNLMKDESISVMSADGATEYTLELTDITKTGPNVETYTAALKLMDASGVTVDSKANIVAGENLKDKFNVALADVYITDLVVSDLIAETGYATVRTGEDRISMKNNSGFPFMDDPAVDNIAKWRSHFTIGAFTGVTIKNYWAFNKTIGSETNTSKNVLKVGESIEFPNEFAKLELIGFQDKPMNEVQIGNGQLVYPDRKGSQITVPFYKQFDFADQEASVISIGNETYTLWTETGTLDFNILYAKGNHAITARPTAGSTWTQTPNMNFNTIGTAGTATYNLDGNQMAFDLGARPYTGTTSDDVNYVIAANSVSGIGYMLLADQNFSIYNRSGGLGTQLQFAGTQVAVSDANNGGGYIQPFYLSNESDVIATALGGSITVDLNISAVSPAPATKTIQYDDENYYAGLFYFSDATGLVETTLAVRADADGTVWNYNDLADKTTIVTFGPTLDASNADWTSSAIRDGADYLMAASTRYGTEISSDNSVFTLSVPEERRKVEAYLGASGTTQVPTGGADYTDVAVGSTEGGVTITAVDGTASGIAGGVEVVASGDLVKVAGAFSGGKSIIVGGFNANTAARNLQVNEGNTLEDMLVASGDYVAAVLSSGDIVAAGYTGDDTGDAAGALIDALEALI